MKVLTLINPKKRRQRRATGKIAAFAALNWKNGDVNGVQLEKTTVLTFLNRKNSGVNDVQPEKKQR